MRSKTPLALMEQVIMVLVFALAAALCLQVFLVSGQMSEKNRDTDNAVLLAQNAAATGVYFVGGVIFRTETCGHEHGLATRGGAHIQR